MAETFVFQIGIELATINCCSCDSLFAVESSIKERWRNSGKSFHCPHCGTSQSYSKSKVQELEDKIKQLRDLNTSMENDRQYWFNEYESEKNSKKAYKGHFTRLKKKVRDGNCPCCDKHFPDLKKHIEAQHPEFVEEVA